MTTNKLRVVVIGGGIAGLSAAAVLRQKHDVTVYDRDEPTASSASTPERGAGIGLGPNGTKMLKKAFQFSPENVKATVCAGSRTYDKQGNLLREITGVSEPFGGEWLLMHRGDLRDELLRLATGDAAKLGISGSPATVVDGSQVVGVDVEEGKVKLKNGEDVTADVIVGKTTHTYTCTHRDLYTKIQGLTKHLRRRRNPLSRPTGCRRRAVSHGITGCLTLPLHVPARGGAGYPGRVPGRDRPRRQRLPQLDDGRRRDAPQHHLLPLPRQNSAQCGG